MVLFSVVDGAKALRANREGFVRRMRFDYEHAGILRKTTTLTREIGIADTSREESLFKKTFCHPSKHRMSARVGPSRSAARLRCDALPVRVGWD